MNERNNLMIAIQMYDFYLYELQLYLDTHPTCRNALSTYSRYKQLRDNAYKMYTEKYGPITADQSSCENVFEWVSDPWPWERSSG